MTTEISNSVAQALLTIEANEQALAKAESRYLSKNPQDKAGNALTASDDIAKARKFISVENLAHFESMLGKAGIDVSAWVTAVADRLPVKAIMRAYEFNNALHSGDYKLLDATTCNTILANVGAGAVSRDAVSFAVTGKGDANTSDLVKNVELCGKIRRVFEKVGVGTEPTQVSRSFGINGFCGALGIGQFVIDEKSGDRTLTVNAKSPFYRKVFSMIDRASPETLSMMKGKKKGE